MHKLLPHVTPPEDMVWKDIDPVLVDRFQAKCREWEGTPYVKGNCVKGRGADCIQLVAGVYNCLLGLPQEPLPRLSPDSGVHSLEGGFETIREGVRRYGLEFVMDKTLEVGDIIMVRPNPDMVADVPVPAHVMMVYDEGQVFHSAGCDGGESAVITSIHCTKAIVAVLRCTHKEDWQ